MKLMKHQISAIERARETRDLALFMDPGVGKTLTAIKIYQEKCELYGRTLKALVFAPKSVLGSWKNEFGLYTDISPQLVTVLNDASNKKRLSLFLEKIKSGTGQVFVVNYEALLSKELHQAFINWAPEILICDESHKLKSHNSKRSKAMESIASKALHRYLLTGTPITNKEEDLFQQFKILDGGETFGAKFFVFQKIYFEDENAAWSHKQNHFPKYVMRKTMINKFKELVAAKSIQAKKEDCIDLPPLVFKSITVELSPEQKRLYKEMKEELVAFIKAPDDRPRAVIAELAMHKALRLQQIVSGFVRVERTETEPGIDIRIKENPRLDLLSELIEEIVPYEKVIIWCCFRENYAMIEEMLKKARWNYAMIVGGVKNFQAEIDKFQNDPSCRIMIANQQAGGAGINLQQGSTAIYYSKNFNWAEDSQSLARCYRKGSDIHQKVTRIDILAENTIDVIVNEALMRKQNISDLILDWSNI